MIKPYKFGLCFANGYGVKKDLSLVHFHFFVNHKNKVILNLYEMANSVEYGLGVNKHTGKAFVKFIKMRLKRIMQKHNTN
ncbi:hypothetical protein AN642_03080 [Epulopiscium sp. SCG-B10WGA-EpuloA2]|nr:hypothetical protein AN642_03080 [Epulopiscium sp. SCG-B10WGA-EpuloA2]